MRRSGLPLVTAPNTGEGASGSDGLLGPRWLPCQFLEPANRQCNSALEIGLRSPAEARARLRGVRIVPSDVTFTR